MTTVHPPIESAASWTGDDPAQASLRDETRAAARAGARDILPLLAAVTPFAVVIGVTIAGADVDPVAGWAASLLLCAGTAQLTAVQLLDHGATPLAVIATVVVVNSRFALYSAGLARWFADEPLWRRLVLAFPLVDQLFVLVSTRFASRPHAAHERRAYYTAAAAVLVTGWVATQALAVRFAASIPDVGVLRLAPALVFVGLLTGAVGDRGTAAAAVVGGVGAVAAAGAPNHLGIVVGIALGIAAGMALDTTPRPTLDTTDTSS